jgi:hypothetical protein
MPVILNGVAQLVSKFEVSISVYTLDYLGVVSPLGTKRIAIGRPNHLSDIVQQEGTAFMPVTSIPEWYNGYAATSQ